MKSQDAIEGARVAPDGASSAILAAHALRGTHTHLLLVLHAQRSFPGDDADGLVGTVENESLELLEAAVFVREECRGALCFWREALRLHPRRRSGRLARLPLLPPGSASQTMQYNHFMLIRSVWWPGYSQWNRLNNLIAARPHLMLTLGGLGAGLYRVDGAAPSLARSVSASKEPRTH